MKKKYIITISVITFLGIAVITGLLIAEADRTAAGAVLPDTNIEDGKGIAYVDEDLDAFFILDGADWQYETTGYGNQKRFYDSDYHCIMMIQSINDSNIFYKEKVKKIWEKYKKGMEITDYTQSKIQIGSYEGNQYEYLTGTENEANVTMIIWATSAKVYMVAFSQIDKNYNEAELAIKSIESTFLTYKEYLKAREASTN